MFRFDYSALWFFAGTVGFNATDIRNVEIPANSRVYTFGNVLGLISHTPESILHYTDSHSLCLVGDKCYVVMECMDYTNENNKFEHAAMSISVFIPEDDTLGFQTLTEIPAQDTFNMFHSLSKLKSFIAPEPAQYTHTSIFAESEHYLMFY